MTEEALDALSPAASARGRGHTGVEPERDPGVPEVVGPLGQAGGEFRAGQDILPCPCPRRAVRGCVHVVAGLVPEQPTVRRHTEPFDVCEEHAHELRREGHRPGCRSRTALGECTSCTAPSSVHSFPAVTTPPRQVEHPPPGLGQMALLASKVNDLRRTHGRVVHAAEERLKARTAPTQLGDRSEQAGDLSQIGDGSRVHLLVDRRSAPPEPLEGVLREITLLHSAC